MNKRELIEELSAIVDKDERVMAPLLGVYCGYRWASDCTSSELKKCYKRHREQVATFAEMCERMTPLLESDAPDDYAAQYNLYIGYAKCIEGAANDIGRQKGFWSGFRVGADSLI